MIYKMVFINLDFVDLGFRLNALWKSIYHSPFTICYFQPHLIFNVTIANTTHRIVTIQNLVTILLS